MSFERLKKMKYYFCENLCYLLKHHLSKNNNLNLILDIIYWSQIFILRYYFPFFYIYINFVILLQIFILNLVRYVQF